jgi:hypothetical protein
MNPSFLNTKAKWQLQNIGYTPVIAPHTRVHHPLSTSTTAKKSELLCALPGNPQARNPYNRLIVNHVVFSANHLRNRAISLALHPKNGSNQPYKTPMQ